MEGAGGSGGNREGGLGPGPGRPQARARGHAGVSPLRACEHAWWLVVCKEAKPRLAGLATSFAAGRLACRGSRLEGGGGGEGGQG